MQAVLDLPKKTPCCFICGHEYLVVAHPMHCLWRSFLAEPMTWANMMHGQTRRVVL